MYNLTRSPTYRRALLSERLEQATRAPVTGWRLFIKIYLWRGALRDDTTNGCVADYRVARNFGGSLYWRFFGVLRELIFATRTDWFFLAGINFCDF